MKVVYVTPDVGRVSETFVSDLVRGLSEKVASLTVICNNDQRTVSSDTYQVEEVPFLNLQTVVDRLCFRLYGIRQKRDQQHNLLMHQARKQLRPVLRREEPDVAYVDFGRTAAAAHAPLVELGIPFVAHFHGADVTSQLSDAAYRRELQKIFRDAFALIVASHHIRRMLVLEGAPPKKIEVSRYDIDLEGVEPLPWEERRDETPSVVFLGRFTPKKHPVALVEAFRLVKDDVPSATLTMIGDGPEMPRVRKRLRRHGLEDSVALHGALPRKKALAIVRGHWVYAQHSVTARSGDQEGFGISLAEAAALELPVVSTLHNGIPEQVINGETGFLVREHDYEAMAERLVHLLGTPDKAEKMGIAGSENIEDLCNERQRTAKIASILRDKQRSG